MVSVLQKSTAVMSIDKAQPKIQLNELGNLCDSVQPFTQLILKSGRPAVRLHCAVPTWSPSSDLCTHPFFDKYISSINPGQLGLDLHDLHELRSRFLLFIHDLLHSLRTSGVSASYCLAPSSSPLCLVCAMPPGMSSKITTTACDLLKNAQPKKREHVLLADLEAGPCLVIT